MGDVVIVVEHRQGEIREITHQMLCKANELFGDNGRNITAVLLASGDAKKMADELRSWADRILVFEDQRFEYFSSDLYKEVLLRIIKESSPFLIMIGQTPWGMDLAPALSIKSRLPMASDCVDISIEDNRPLITRQIYNGKIFARVSLKESDSYIITIRPGAFQAEMPDGKDAEIIIKDTYTDLPSSTKEFIKYEEAGVGEVDISQAELLVSIGRGIGEQENINIIKELAEKMGGLISCSRPIVDKKWLPKYHQVGTSGKSVKPKVYLAFGISGAFQHVAGITGAGTVIAINKDPKAPIFRVADYGVVEDLFKIVDALKEKLSSS
jgi:electron transfer flavoprotein alpha subunit